MAEPPKRPVIAYVVLALLATGLLMLIAMWTVVIWLWIHYA